MKRRKSQGLDSYVPFLLSVAEMNFGDFAKSFPSLSGGGCRPQATGEGERCEKQSVRFSLIRPSATFPRWGKESKSLPCSFRRRVSKGALKQHQREKGNSHPPPCRGRRPRRPEFFRPGGHCEPVSRLVWQSVMPPPVGRGLAPGVPARFLSTARPASTMPRPPPVERGRRPPSGVRPCRKQASNYRIM